MSVCTGAQPPTWGSSLSKDSNRHSMEAPQELQQPRHHVPVPGTKADFHCPARSNLGPEGSHNWREAEPGETWALSAGQPLPARGAGATQNQRSRGRRGGQWPFSEAAQSFLCPQVPLFHQNGPLTKRQWLGPLKSRSHLQTARPKNRPWPGLQTWGLWAPFPHPDSPGPVFTSEALQPPSPPPASLSTGLPPSWLRRATPLSQDCLLKGR